MHLASSQALHRTRVFRPLPLTTHSARLAASRHHCRRRSRVVAATSGSDESTGPIVQEGTTIKKTMADLDAILGIEEEEEAASGGRESKDQVLTAETEEEIRSLAQEVSRKLTEEDSAPDKTKEQDFIEKMTEIVQSASSNAEGKKDEKQLVENLEKLLESVSLAKDENNEDIKVMKDRVFGADTFWVTEVMEPNDEFGGHRFRGNMRRTNEQETFWEIVSRVQELFGEKYEVLMFEEALTPEQLGEANPQPKVCFQVIPAESARPPKSPSWRPVAAGVLFLFTLASAYVLGVSSNVGNIPKPVADYLSQPDHFNSDQWPEYVQNWDPSAFLASSATVAASVMALQFLHEAGHRVIAFLKGIKLKSSLFLPSTQIGTLGSTTQLDALVKTRQDLWDFAFGGIAFGGVSSFALLVAGLLFAQDPAVSKEGLIPVPSLLLQGSTLLGSLLQAAMGEGATARTVYLHPFTIAGWCGLTTTALNCLPVGNLDGGRMMQAAFGRRPLNVSSIFVYAGLALGIIGSSLALPFGLYVLICDREPERYVQNQVTPTERTRKWITGVCIGLAILTLLPMSLFDPTDAGVGPAGPLI